MVHHSASPLVNITNIRPCSKKLQQQQNNAPSIYGLCTILQNNTAVTLYVKDVDPFILVDSLATVCRNW